MNEEQNVGTILLKNVPSVPLTRGYAQMMEILNAQTQKYPFIAVESILRTAQGMPLPFVTLGEGKKTIYYLGTADPADGREEAVAALLLRFIEEYAEAYRQRKRIFNTYLPRLWEEWRIAVCPLFRQTDTPGAGVCWGELGNLIRYGPAGTGGVLCFMPGKGVVRPLGKPFTQQTRRLAGMAGFLPACTPAAPLPELPELPSFAVECPVPVGKEAFPTPAECFGTYAALRQLFFEGPNLF